VREEGFNLGGGCRGKPTAILRMGGGKVGVVRGVVSWTEKVLTERKQPIRQSQATRRQKRKGLAGLKAEVKDLRERKGKTDTPLREGKDIFVEGGREGPLQN